MNIKKKMKKESVFVLALLLAGFFFGSVEKIMAADEKCCVKKDNNVVKCQAAATSNNNSSCPNDFKLDNGVCSSNMGCPKDDGCCKKQDGACEQAYAVASCSNGSTYIAGIDKCAKDIKDGGSCNNFSTFASTSTPTNPGTGSVQNLSFSNPLDFNTVEGFLENLLGYIQSIIAVLSVVFIVIGGVLYIISGGNEGMKKMASGAIIASMIGFAIAVAAPSFLREISDILGWDGEDSKLSQALTLTAIALNTLSFLLSIIGILAILMIIIGGISYMTAVGDPKKSETGSKIILYSIIGLIAALLSLVIVRQITVLLT